MPPAVPEVRLPGEAAAFIAAGGRDVDSARLTLDSKLAPGATVVLLDDRGDELGRAIHDPDNARLRVLALPDDGFTKLDGALIGWRVERAIALRKALGLVAPEATYRLIHGAGDGLPGFACDILGQVAVVYAYSAALVPLGRQVAEAARGFAQCKGAVVKIRARGSADQVPQESIGDVPDVLVAREHDVPHEIHPLGGPQHRAVHRHARAAPRARALRQRPPRAQPVLVHRRALARVRPRRRGDGQERRHVAGRGRVGQQELRAVGPR